LPEIICNTSPLQYLHQLKLLDALRQLTKHLVVPQAVTEELRVGSENGWDVPDLRALDWIEVRQPRSKPVLPLIHDLGPGETEVLALALESPDPLVILDDGLARQVAASLNLKLTGTLGLLLDVKKAGLIPSVAPMLDELQRLRFRVSPRTRSALLKFAGEA
jgi:predicted nucleic acid-binding protein